MGSRKVAAPSLPCAADKLNHMEALKQRVDNSDLCSTT
jgi:hypothetical protein